MSTPDIAHARARTAALTRHRGRGSEQAAAARAELEAAKREAAIRRIIDAWPPLTAEQRDRLALLLHPDAGTGDGGAS